MFYLCTTMHFMSQLRYNPKTRRDEWYYRIKESYRDLTGRVRSRVMLNVGFIDEDHRAEDIRDIGKCLTYLYEHQGERDLFKDPFARYNDFVRRKSSEFWRAMVNGGSIDAVQEDIEASREKAGRLIDVDTVEHTDAREVGAEWMCLQALRELEIDRFLAREGWSEVEVNTALAHLIVRTVYSPSELKSMRIMEDNSAVCELLSGSQDWRPTFRGVYDVAPRLYALKDRLEQHLCDKTDDLFSLDNTIAIFDLTNFFFEGQKPGSAKAKFGRSKEKRSDCRLLVLALCINEAGFIRYSSILAGNTADPKSLPDMVDTLAAKSRAPRGADGRALVIIDAGIATEDNLMEIRSRGYDYLCVSRTRLTDYELADDMRSVTVMDARKQPITLREVRHKEGGDYYLEVTSPGKTVKEKSMNAQWRERFETELTKARDALTQKGGTKNYEKVIERVGRARQKYPSVSRYYVIDYVRDEGKPQHMADIKWRIAVPDNVDKDCGVYFLRTNRKGIGEKQTWDYYNLVREIECTNRQLKTDLNLRPIYHQKDDRSDAHLFLGLLAYWVVNTIRYKMKLVNGEREREANRDKKPSEKQVHHPTPYWTEIVRVMSTQKAITTEANNALGEKVNMRICSYPNKKAEYIYDILKYKKMPFRKIKICSTQ